MIQDAGYTHVKSHEELHILGTLSLVPYGFHTYHVWITIQRVAIQKCIADSMFGENGQSAADDAAEGRERTFCNFTNT